MHPGIRIDRIRVAGFAGLLFVIASCGMFLAGIPATRTFLLITVPVGVVGAGFLYYWHHRTGR